MLTRSLCALACLVVAGAVLGQSPSTGAGTNTNTRARSVLGKATELQGLVTVSDGSAVSRVVLNQPVVQHTRYVTSSTGYVTLKMDNGCDIVLKPNQALTVEDEQDCGALWAAIQSLGGTAAAGASSGVAPFIVGGAVILLLGGGDGPPPTGVFTPDPSGGGSGGGGDIPISPQ
jgi:hypothetical protein